VFPANYGVIEADFHDVSEIQYSYRNYQALARFAGSCLVCHRFARSTRSGARPGAGSRTITVNATASCVDGHVVLTWSAQADALARVTVSYMGLNSGPYDLAPTFKVEGRLHTVVGSASATVATFASQYWSGNRWVNMTTQTKSLDAISCNTPTAVRLSTFTAANGGRSLPTLLVPGVGMVALAAVLARRPRK
jgi:hypothetical protein